MSEGRGIDTVSEKDTNNAKITHDFNANKIAEERNSVEAGGPD